VATAVAESEPLDAAAAARDAGLRYVTDAKPGITRRKAGTGFSYRMPSGERISDREVLGRIRALAVPPAWTEVWICPTPSGHLQATGRDVRGRKQYRYHPEWRRVRDEAKFDRVVEFGGSLPRIRKAVDRDLDRRGVPRRKVLAAVVRLLDRTLIRVGNDEYARLNNSFGATTMRNRHAEVNGHTVRFTYAAKSGRKHSLRLVDQRLAAIVRRCQGLPGQELFAYVGSDDVIHDVGSADVNEYLREISGDDFTAKDFRTFGGTVIAAWALCEIGPARTRTKRRANVVEAVRLVARELNNTPTVARSAYIHPAVLEAYEDDELPCDVITAAHRRSGWAGVESSTVRFLAAG
jgi:DNA topoisomerase-1